MADDGFDWVEEPTEEEDSFEIQEDEEPEQRRSAKDYLRFKAAKRLDGNGVSPQYRNGYAEGYTVGLEEGKKIGYAKGLEYMRKHYESCDLPD